MGSNKAVKKKESIAQMNDKLNVLFIVADDYVEQNTLAENSQIYPIIKTYNPILISKISSMIEDTNSGMLTSEEPILGNT